MIAAIRSLVVDDADIFGFLLPLSPFVHHFRQCSGAEYGARVHSTIANCGGFVKMGGLCSS